MFLLFILASGFCLLTPAFSQTPALTTVKDTVYRSDGTPASGTVVITWPAFVTGDSKAVFGGTKTLPLVNGALAVALVPNSGATPSGTSYQVKYFQSGGVFFEETWVVPTSSPLANPAQPVSVTQVGTPGSTTYYYWCTATNASGETLLSPSRITTTSNATLDMTNYNVIICATVTGATGYTAYRTTTASAPSGTGNYLVGSSATTTINDQSNTLESATIPALNTTDPRTLSAVRVTATPSSNVTFAASQVQGNAIVSSPSATQTITAPAGSGAPLELRGRSGNSDPLLNIYNNAASPALVAYWSAAGQQCFEGSSVDANDTCFSVTNPTAPRAITVPNADTVLVVGDAGAANQFLTAISPTTGAISKAQPAFSNLSGAATLAQLPFGAANQVLGTNAGATAQEHKTLAVGSSGTDFAIAHAANSITLNLPDASATARGALTTGTQTLAGNKIFNGSVAIGAGTAVLKHLSATASLDFTALAANSCETFSITVMGAADGDTVTLGIPDALADVDGATERTTFFGWVSATDTVSVRRCNLTGAATAEPSAATVRADVWQH